MSRFFGLRFDRNEWAGAFGDLGTDLPLIVGVMLAAGLDAASVLTLFGAMQLLTALSYRMPMPVQPLKAMAALVIAQQIAGPVLYGAGLAIGAVMLVLSLTGAVNWLARAIPRCVVRGIQFGLGLQLASLALKKYVPAEAAAGWCLAGAAFIVTVILIGNRRVPAALLVVAMGIIYAALFKLDFSAIAHGAGFQLPQFHAPAWPDIATGFILLTLPQLPLSLGNSVLATRQAAEDLFPERRLSVRKISLTYSIMNLVCPWFGGIPVCHGSGGMAGHYAFGGRTGGSVFLYGLFFIIAGLFFSRAFEHLVLVFPLPILGVLLLFEGLALMMLARDTTGSISDFAIVLLVGLLAVGLPYGYVLGLVVGALLARFRWHPAPR